MTDLTSHAVGHGVSNDFKKEISAQLTDEDIERIKNEGRQAEEVFRNIIDGMQRLPTQKEMVAQWRESVPRWELVGSKKVLVKPKDTAKSLTGLDNVDHPPHYADIGKYEPIDVIEDWDLEYHTGCALKYIARFKHKGKPAEDLRKAAWYLMRYADLLEGKIGVEEGS